MNGDATSRVALAEWNAGTASHCSNAGVGKLGDGGGHLRDVGSGVPAKNIGIAEMKAVHRSGGLSS